MSDYQGKTFYLQGSAYTVEKTIAEGMASPICIKLKSLDKTSCYPMNYFKGIPILNLTVVFTSHEC